jgi:hypothetical protein
MSQPLQISGKHLGQLALPDACDLCFWLKLKTGFRLPYQIFPGIFSSIDSYTKKITNEYYLKVGELPAWFIESGLSGEPVKTPTLSQFFTEFPEYQIKLTGIPDEIIRDPEGRYHILDYKTARFTGTQDKLLPMYEVQLNAYGLIAESLDLRPVRSLSLWYFEPKTELHGSNIGTRMLDLGFRMNFHAQKLMMDYNPESLNPLLKKARQLFDMPHQPAGNADCPDCQKRNKLMELLS